MITAPPHTLLCFTESSNDSLNNQTEFGNFLVTTLKQWANLAEVHWEIFISSQENVDNSSLHIEICSLCYILPINYINYNFQLITTKVRVPFSKKKRNRKSNLIFIKMKQKQLLMGPLCYVGWLCAIIIQSHRRAPGKISAGIIVTPIQSLISVSPRAFLEHLSAQHQWDVTPQKPVSSDQRRRASQFST